MTQETKKDFFINYNKADSKWAEWISWQLEEGGRYSVVVQAWDFKGSNFVLDMHQALLKTERTIGILSPDYLKAEFTATEWAAIIADDPKGAKGRLILVKVRECQPDGLLKAVPYVNLVGLDEAAARQRLLEGVKCGRAKPESEPDFPGHPRRIEPSFPGTISKVPKAPSGQNTAGTSLKTGKPPSTSSPAVAPAAMVVAMELKIPNVGWSEMQEDLLRIGGRGSSYIMHPTILRDMGLIEREPKEARPNPPIPNTAPKWAQILALLGEFTVETAAESRRKWQLTDLGRNLYLAFFVDENIAAAKDILRKASRRIPIISMVSDQFAGKGWIKPSQLEKYLEFKGIPSYSYLPSVFIELLDSFGVVDIDRLTNTFSIPLR